MPVPNFAESMKTGVNRALIVGGKFFIGVRVHSLMKQAQKQEISITFTGPLYPSLVRRFEVLSGRDFSSTVFSFSAYKAVCEMIAEQKVSGEKLVSFVKDIIKKTVGGKVTSFSFSKDSGGVVRIENCAEAKLHGPSESGVCFLSAGMLEAVLEKYSGKQVHITERKCVSKGDSCCEFAATLSGANFAQEGTSEAPQGLSDLASQ